MEISGSVTHILQLKEQISNREEKKWQKLLGFSYWMDSLFRCHIPLRDGMPILCGKYGIKCISNPMVWDTKNPDLYIYFVESRRKHCRKIYLLYFFLCVSRMYECTIGNFTRRDDFIFFLLKIVIVSFWFLLFSNRFLLLFFMVKICAGRFYHFWLRPMATV